MATLGVRYAEMPKRCLWKPTHTQYGWIRVWSTWCSGGDGCGMCQGTMRQELQFVSYFHIWRHDSPPPFLFPLPLLHLLSLLIPPLLLARIESHSKALSKEVLSLVFIKILPK